MISKSSKLYISCQDEYYFFCDVKDIFNLQNRDVPHLLADVHVILPLWFCIHVYFQIEIITDLLFIFAHVHYNKRDYFEYTVNKARLNMSDIEFKDYAALTLKDLNKISSRYAAVLSTCFNDGTLFFLVLFSIVICF